MAWILLVIAGLLEIVCLVVSFALLPVSMRTLPLGTAYAGWTGIGAVMPWPHEAIDAV